MSEGCFVGGIGVSFSRRSVQDMHVCSRRRVVAEYGKESSFEGEDRRGPGAERGDGRGPSAERGDGWRRSRRGGGRRERPVRTEPPPALAEDVLSKFRDRFPDPKRISVDTDMLEVTRDSIVKIKDDVRVIVEVRDPRVPMSSASSLFLRWREELDTESMVVYTKAELLDEHSKERIREFTMDQMGIPYENVFFEDLRMVRKLRTPDRAEVVSKIKRLALARGLPRKYESFKVMVTGVPNSGKSSLVYVSTRTLTKNRKRRGLYHLPPVGFQVGTTKTVGMNWLSLKPDVVMLDMPGVITESHTGADDPETPYRLAATQCVSLTKIERDNGIDVVEVADYLLFKLNQRREFTYTRVYDMLLPTDDIHELLRNVPGSTEQQQALRFLRDYQHNRLGFVILDDIPEVDTERPDVEDADAFVDEVESRYQEYKKKARFERERQRKTYMWRDDSTGIDYRRPFGPDDLLWK